MLRCCIVDDEPLAAKLIASYIEKTPFMQLAGIFCSAHEAVRPLMQGEVDVAFLDIRMPQLDGIEFARLVPEGVQTVFVTAYSEYAVQAFKVGASDYLMKPVSFEEFSATALRLYNRHNGSAPDETAPKIDGRMLVKLRHGLEQINVADIILIEGLKDYVKIHMGNRPAPIVTLSSMRNIERHLPDDSFMRVHRSFIVNTSRIQRIDRQKIVIADRDIPVGDSYRTRVSDYIASHLPSE